MSYLRRSTDDDYLSNRTCDIYPQIHSRVLGFLKRYLKTKCSCDAQTNQCKRITWEHEWSKKTDNFTMAKTSMVRSWQSRNKQLLRNMTRTSMRQKARTHKPAHRNENMRENRSNMHGHVMKQNKNKKMC